MNGAKRHFMLFFSKREKRKVKEKKEIACGIARAVPPASRAATPS
jgi:hypothetical protein